MVVSGEGFTLSEVLKDVMTSKAFDMQIETEDVDGEDVIQSQTKSVNDILAELDASLQRRLGLKSREIVDELKQMVLPIEDERKEMTKSGRLEMLDQ